MKASGFLRAPGRKTFQTVVVLEGGQCRDWEEKSRNNSAAFGQGPGSPQGYPRQCL